MNTDNIKKELFKRDISNYEDILDDYWTIEIPKIAKQDKRLAFFFEDVNYSDIELSIAGKSNGPDEASFNTAVEKDVRTSISLQKKYQTPDLNP